MKRTGIPLRTNAQRYAFIGALFGLLFPIFATLIYLLDTKLSFDMTSILAAYSKEPLLWIIVTAPIFLGIFAAIAGRRQDDLEKANHALQSRERELQATQLILEQRVDERTQELTAMNQLIMERGEQLESVIEASRSLLSIQELDHLFPSVVQVIGQQFKFYHVGLYLLDEQKQRIVLMASSTEGVLGRNQPIQPLRMGRQNQIEFAIRTGQPRLLSDTMTDSTLSHESELPNSRSEVVLPLKSGQIAIGALDLHSDRTDEIRAEHVSILSILADLVAIGVQNSILHEKTQRTLLEAEQNSRQISSKVWKDWVESIHSRGYRYDGIRAEPLKETGAISKSQGKIQTIPIRLRGRTIGNLKVTLSDASPGWTDDDLAIAEATAERAALALEGARLLEEAKRRAAREAFLSEIAAKLGTSFQLDSILRDTVEELGQTLAGSTVTFQLINSASPHTTESIAPDESPADRRDAT